VLADDRHEQQLLPVGGAARGEVRDPGVNFRAIIRPVAIQSMSSPKCGPNRSASSPTALVRTPLSSSREPGANTPSSSTEPASCGGRL
jgi:hypothetical protein